MRALTLAAVAGLLAWSLSTQAGEIRASVKDLHGKAVSDAVVTAMPLDEPALSKAKAPTDSIDQVDKQFVPYVKPVMLGSSVQFANSDHVRHQVYSFSPAKSFELPLYGGRDAPRITFDKAGVVILGCNIHDWMLGYIYVAATPFFVKTENSGTAVLANLPAGRYQVRIWHPGMEHSEDATLKLVQVTEQIPVSLDWQISVKSSYRVPRMSGGSSTAYP